MKTTTIDSSSSRLTSGIPWGLSPVFFGAAVMLGAALAFTLLSALIKGLPPRFRIWDIAFYRFFSNALLILFIIDDRRKLFQTHQIRLLILRGLAGCIAFLVMVFAVRSISFSMAMVLFYTFPAFAALFSAVLFSDRISRKHLFWLIVTFSGVFIIFEYRLDSHNLLGQAMALSGGVLAGLTVSLIKKLRDTQGALPIYFYLCAAGSLVSFIPYIQSPKIPAGSGEWIFLAGIVIASFAGQMMMTYGFKYCKSWEGGMLLTMEVVFAVIIGVFFFGETLAWRFWTGGALILTGVLAMNYKRKARGI